ncbi:hypothetical protein [Streptosporangium carneum]|uniref:Polysaccharide chain length determinant N-terminal domain-containing protein n=1 Tax=Streptosporangium carneum TaxID=47481 RepID=A0A9W6MHN1_9ACTN|nr:hypothetical protein [Streptosporangium carneum]GLK14365.1 hypothetical protein GCM10017600_77770 [Streptosporangium carneum]
MDLLGSLRAIRRWWWIAAPLALLTMVGAVVAAAILPWDYESRATLLLLSSPQVAKEAGGNPYLYFSNSLNVTAQVVGVAVMNDRTVTSVKARGLSPTYSVGLQPNTGGPILEVVAEADRPELAQTTMEQLIVEVNKRLQTLQSGIAVDGRVRVVTVTTTEKAIVRPTAKIRTVTVIGGGGLLVTLLVPVVIEAISERRRQQRQGAKGRERQNWSGPEGAARHAAPVRSPDDEISTTTFSVYVDPKPSDKSGQPSPDGVAGDRP